MGTTPRGNEQKMDKILNAWETLAADKIFGGMTHPQFQAVCAPAKAAREKIEDLEDQLSAALVERDQADDAVAAKIELVVNSVRADPDHGSNSALYEAMGYTRKSDRKSGLTQKKKTPSAP